jgi:hypothetical protein
MVGCVAGTPIKCDDSISCTADFCDTKTDACAHVKQDTACDNAVFCDGVEKCDPPNGDAKTGCTTGTPVDCNDKVACTSDSCDEAQAQCVHTAVNAACDDGVFCDGLELCDPQLGCQATGPVNCDDGLSCTADACDEAQKMCTHAPNDAACSDGLNCNGQEKCDPNGQGPSGCKAGTPIPCGSDGIACTVDACDEASSSCKHTPDNSLCPSNQFCVVGQNGCTAGTPCSNGAQCQDGNLCNGVETCTNGICHPGTAVNCDDGIYCTTDSCNPATGACTNAPNNAFCDDGKACNGVETCDPTQDCVPGTPIQCADSVACTFDVCDEQTGACSHVPNNGFCDDGKLCNGQETCTPSGCQPAAAPYVCPSDGIKCTTEVCDSVSNSCKSIPDNSVCGCGQTCDAATGCGNHCVVATCQGKVYQCGDCIDNDGDCKIDSQDPDCLGPCSNNESGFYGNIPGQNNSPCKQDCYFDGDTGAGNDDCYWSHKCDPHEQAPNYAPESSQCAYNINASIPGTPENCSQLMTSQSNLCHSYCGPLTPNGCDCFGCCAIPGAPTPVWIGSQVNNAGSCTLNTLNDPTKCKPCEQVTACLNPCDTCELCVGKTTLPPQCAQQSCPTGSQACDAPGQPPCPAGSSCITGCCQNNPQ